MNTPKLIEATDPPDATYPQGRLEQMRKTVDEGVSHPLSWRLAQLDGLLRFIEDQEAEMLQALKADLGRCSAEARMADITMVRAEIKLIRRKLRGWLSPQYVRTPLAAQPGRSWIQQEPLGLALILGAWNYPFQQILIPLAGALAAGNASVVKPSEIAPCSASLLERQLKHYIDPAAAVVVSGGPEVASRLLQFRFDTIFYTGSNRVGRIVLAAAAGNLTPVTLELGGKSPVIVDETTPLDVTARRIVWGRFMNAGQICVAPDYVLVPESLRVPLIDAMQLAVTRFYGQDPQQSKSFGRIVNDQHFGRLLLLMREGKVAIGGQSDPSELYIAPTVLTDLPENAAVLEEEIFGPILPVMGYRDLDQALAFIRKRPKPLALYLFSGSRTLQDRVIRDVSSGSLVINDVLVSQVVPGLPFGGVGASGMGSFHGRYTFDAFSHSKAVVRRSLRADLDVRYPPFTGMKDRLLSWLLAG